MPEKARFGPAGNCEAFYSDGKKATIQAPGWLEKIGLNAYEYQCGRGVTVGTATAQALGEKAREHNIYISLHAPYYISLASADPEKRGNSVGYILQSARAVTAMGGERIIVHPGGLGGLPRSEAAELAAQTLKKARDALDNEGFVNIVICPEVMGKINQLGDLDEIIFFCGLDERMIPCIDFGHLYTRTLGEINSREAYTAVLDKIEDKLGTQRARSMHIHFSKIQYTASGEKKHLKFENSEFGPEPEPLMTLLAQRGYTPVVICESDGTQAEDALVMKGLFEKNI